MNKLTIGLMSSLLCCLSLSAAQAATVSPQSGEVLINDGRGFVAVTGAAELAPGGQLMVRPGGMALISYAGGCVLRVGSGRVWVVQETPPCADGNQAVDYTGRMNGGSLKDGPVEEERRDLTPFILGGGVIAASITLMLTERNDHPSSP